MHLKKIFLKNIRCFEEFTLEFEKSNSSVLIVGDNGEGKSTLLRSIAMGLCDSTSASALFRELGGRFVRRGKEEEDTFIDLYLSNGPEQSFIIETKWRSLKKSIGGSLESLTQIIFSGHKKNERNIIDQEEFPWKSIFIAGYGAGLRTSGSATLDSYLAVDAVYPLFRYDEPLLNPELALRRLVDEEQKRQGRKSKVVPHRRFGILNDFLELLKNILNLGKHDRVYLTRQGIEVRGPWGRCGLESLGDGYKSTIIWVLDLIGRRLLYSRTLNPEQMTGIVLLDEVEQHLHPRWQLNAMPLIQKAFPKIQFIATTHSPLVASGCKNCKIRKITSKHDESSSVYGWLAEDVYREVMDLPTTRYKDVANLIKEFEKLYAKKISGMLSAEDGEKLRKVEEELNRLPGGDPTVLTTKLKNLRIYLQEIDKGNKK
jgi:energy-coupling factor transporter ATP-binding protein EcfA2